MAISRITIRSSRSWRYRASASELKRYMQKVNKKMFGNISALSPEFDVPYEAYVVDRTEELSWKLGVKLGARG